MTFNFLKRYTTAERPWGNRFPVTGRSRHMEPRQSMYSGFLFFCLLVLLLSVFLFVPGSGLCKAGGTERHSSGSSLKSEGPVTPYSIVRIQLSGSINPGMLQFFRRAVRQAELQRAELLLVILNTPGGLVRSLREMIQTVIASRVPVVVYVSPAGAQAASAGALLTMSAHIAAMAPGTNIGAAHPVLPGGAKPGSTMNQKMENDVAALARSIASERGRNIKWAEEAVRKSVSATADEALKLGIIDCIAKNEAELLSKIDGMQVKMADGTLKLHTVPYSVTEISPGLRERIISTLADPDIAYILMMLGAAGLYFELAHPGTILPGVAGAISLILGLFATQVLPVNTTGLLLLLLALLLFLLELFVTSHGILGAAGVVSLLLGSLMLFDTPNTGVALSPSVMWPTVLFAGAFFMTIAFLATRAQLRRPQAGREALIGERGVVRETIGPGEGMVFVHGELWRAVSDGVIERGTEVEVIGVSGMKLTVRKAGPAVQAE